MTDSVALPDTETISPQFRDLESWDSTSILDVLWQGQLAAVASVRATLTKITAAATAAVPRLVAGGRLVYAGAGTSGRIGVQDGAELSPTFHWPRERLVLLTAGGEAALTGSIENAEDDVMAAAAAIALHRVGANDVVVCIAASGTTPFTVRAAREAAARGALTIGVSNSSSTPLLAAVEHAICVETGAEPIAGSTRMQAGTAQKVVLNLLSTFVMLRLGGVYQGLMVDMVATNDKLRKRAVRMLRYLTGCDEDAASKSLEQADGRVKLAVLMLKGLNLDAAESLLQRHFSNFKSALAELRQ